MISSVLVFAEDWHTFTSVDGRSFVGRITHVDEDQEEVIVTKQRDKRTATMPFDILSEDDLDYVKNWRPAEKGDADGSDDADDSDVAASARLYPKTKDEIKERLNEIEKRKAPSGISKDVQIVVNRLNQYRFLSGVPDEVEVDEKMVAQANDAAQACEKNGNLSHDLGHSTEICNLAGGSNMLASVPQYMEDGGNNNRDARGHRRWCLNPPMGKTGFGEAGQYSAMVSMDSSGKAKMRDSWAYPGKGFFPKKYLHGNAWSLYLDQAPPSEKDLKVEVYKLKKRPEKAFSSKEEIPGKAMPINHVSVYQNAINFEPQAEPVTSSGIYWVRITGGGLREGYLVELY